MLDEYYVLHPTLGEVLLCAEKCIHAEKSPGICQPELSWPKEKSQGFMWECLTERGQTLRGSLGKFSCNRGWACGQRASGC